MNCPKCGYNMDNNINRCDNCGYMIDGQYNPNGYSNYQPNQNQYQNQYGGYQTNQSVNQQPKKKKSKLWIIVIIVFILAMLCCCGGGFGLVHWINNQSFNGDKDTTELLYSIVFDEEDISMEIDNYLLHRDTTENYDKYIIWIDVNNLSNEDITVEFHDIKVNDETQNDIDIYDEKKSNTKLVYQIVINLDNYEDITVEEFSFAMDIESKTKVINTSRFTLHNADNLENAYYDSAHTVTIDEKENEVEIDSNIKKYGSDIVGYVELPGVTWADFYDVDVDHTIVPDMKQYSDMNHIVTLNMVPNGDAESTIDNLKGTLTNVSVTKRENKQQNRYSLLVHYENEGIVAFISCKTIEDKLYYFAIESVPGYFTTPSVLEEYANNIIETYTYPLD